MPDLHKVVLVIPWWAIPPTTLATYTVIKSSLVRFRVSYNPKSLAYEDAPAGELAPRPRVKSYLGMIAWIYHHEGVSGLFKGVVPITLLTFALSQAALLDTLVLRPGSKADRWNLETSSLIGIVGYTIAYPIISLPVTVAINRDIVTPYRRPNTNPLTSFRLLLTPEERRRPWLLYSIPGLFITQMVTAGLFALERNLLSMNSWRMAIPRMVLLSAVMTPFEVIATRLAVQSDRSSDQSEKSLVDHTNAERSTSQFEGLENTTGLPSYTGMIDCARRIIKEEGFRTLYRGWWIPS